MAYAPVNNDTSDEQRMLRDSAVDFCAREAPISRLRALKSTDVDFDAGIWASMTDLGWSAILVPTEHDGMGLGLPDMAVVVEEIGKVAATEPLLETAGLAVSLLAKLKAGTERDRLLRNCAQGNSIVVVCAAEFYQRRDEALPSADNTATGYTLNGSVDCVPLARAADGFLVPARCDGDIAVFWIAANNPALQVHSRKLADNTTQARVELSAITVSSEMLLARGEAAEAALKDALDAYHLLSAASLKGIMSQTLDLTLDYLRTRKQFGQAIGSFQALQHRAVDLFIAREIASAVIEDALGEFEASTDPDRRSMLASRAKFRATDAALKITRAAIQLHGAIGFTYECDIGHYLNRAMVIGSRYGNASWHQRELGQRFAEEFENDEAGSVSRHKNVIDPEPGRWNEMPDEDFRHLVRAWFESEYPAELRYPPRRLHWDEIKPWYMTLSRKGWLAPSWPLKYGGMGLSPAKVMIFIEEQERWGVARAPDMGIIMVGPLLIEHGTEAQRAHYLPKILAGENVWCQGYSEPNSGSDLASLQCEAVLDGDEFVVNGQKTWTTMAQHATHIFLLVRTDKTAKPQSGISFLLADIESPGISVRPIRNLAGDEEFCEVFFDDVRVPAENIVGDINSGWSVAKALLGFERIFLGSPKQSQYALQRLECIAAGSGLFKDSGFLDRYTRLKLDTLDLQALYARYAQIVRDGGTLGPDVSMLKVWATETFAALSELMLEAAGDFGAERGEHDFGAGKANILSQFYNARPATIYGGSNEIQRNILAKNVLELPGR